MHENIPILPPPPLARDEAWFSVERYRDGLHLIREPYVDDFLRANLWLVSGTRSSVLIDCGLGIVPIASTVTLLTEAPCPVVLTHGHLDHAGAAHEFAEVWGHRADEVHVERRLSLLREAHAADLGLVNSALDSGDERDAWLLSRIPSIGWDPRGYRQRPAALTKHLAEGDRLELGGTTLRVLHLPGHTPGSIALYDADREELFSGDVVYDDELLDTLPESSVAAYRRSLGRLRSLPVRLVFPGHDAPFSGIRLREIIDHYLERTA